MYFKNMDSYLFARCTTNRRLLTLAGIMASLLMIELSSTLRGAEEGFLRGSSKTVVHDVDGKREVWLMDFVFACDQDCCLTGTYQNSSEQFILANKGNNVGVSIKLNERKENALKLDGEWSVEYMIEQSGLKLDNSFESRYQAAGFMSNMSIALPVHLSWFDVGVSRDVFINALRGINYRGANELGSLELLGTHGIEKIILSKSGSNLHSRDWLPLSKISNSGYPNGLKSMVKEYSFSPERKFGEYEPFRCVGTIVETFPDDQTRKIEMEIQVTERSDANEARKFINAFLTRLPNNERIISSSEIATVIDGGKQKVAIDRDVERVDEAQFSNESPSILYYVIVIVSLVILGFIGYLRWAQKTG